MKNRIIGVISISNLLTYAGAGAAMTGIMCSMSAMYYAQSFMYGRYIKYAMLCLMLSGVCDLFDGKFARLFKRTDMGKKYGIQIDSLADAVSSGVQPVLLYTALCIPDKVPLLRTAVGIFFVLCALHRLAWYNVITESDPDHFYGMPVVMITLILPVVYCLYQTLALSGTIGYSAALLAAALLFIINIRIKRPDKKIYICWMIISVICGTIIIAK